MIQDWMAIFGITLIIALGSCLIRPRDIPWVASLDRPNWLFFEPAIPLIWTVVFASGAWSATVVWQHEPGSLKTWLLMALYLIVEIITVAYIPATVRTHNLAVGTILGTLGIFLGIILTLLVASISRQAAFLLLPYLLWTPIGTYTTKQMIDLNPHAG